MSANAAARRRRGWRLQQYRLNNISFNKRPYHQQSKKPMA